MDEEAEGICRPRQRAHGTPLSAGLAPNELWRADFKGEFKLGNGHYCYPLTVTDHARYVLLCEALDSTREDMTITAFEQLFRERGLPAAIRSDYGAPSPSDRTRRPALSSSIAMCAPTATATGGTLARCDPRGTSSLRRRLIQCGLDTRPSSSWAIHRGLLAKPQSACCVLPP